MYAYYDVSEHTSKEVIAPRTLRRRGIVVHETVGYDSLEYLQGGSLKDGRRVSSDYLIARNGNIYRITPAGYYSFHSGVARWQLYQENDRTINQGFIGVEVENMPGDGQVMVGPQYIALGFLLRRLFLDNALDIRNVVGHYQVALPQGRKKDPVTLNWNMLTSEVFSPSVQQTFYKVEGKLS